MQTVSQENHIRTTPAETQLYAMLDIGSNAMKLAICQFPDQTPCQTVSITERITRLNRGLDEEGVVNDLAIRRLIEAAGDLIQVARRNGAKILGAVGTAAIRSTTNKMEVLAPLFNEYGIRTRILKPREEAAAGFLAVREQQRLANHLVNGNRNRPLVTFDLGGRSAEMTFGKESTPDSFASLELGSSQLFRLAATSDPPVPAEIDRIRYLVREQLKHVDRPPRDAEVYLIGATATTLAGYVPMLFPKQYGLESLDYLDRDIIRELVGKLAT
ncbi:MAG TPA: hypothetical protein ENH10_01940, partial [Bacteroidetes bacterium]|nr:hypothetical protein [Bacteroidota bacterium]HEX03902.1 hypothetical protein [Bacteroidota bacterium]